MLPNIRLSGTANTPIDSIGDFLSVSSTSVARSVATAAAVVAGNVNRTNNNATNDYANRYAAVAAASGWGNLPPSSILDNINSANSGNKTLADYVKDSAVLQNALNHHHQQQQQQHHQQQTQLHRPATANNNHTTSLPWAAAVKAAEQQQQQQLNAVNNQSANSFERNNTIGSWNSPEVNTNRAGWNSDGSMKSDGTPDDGTAIWGNPTAKKTGIDWAEKESLINPTQTTSNSEKRIQKSEQTISSINGTEAWGAPPAVNSGAGVNSLISKTITNSQQQSKLNENSGNNFGIKSINTETIGWGESSSTSSSLQQGNNECSSPPENSIWNNLTSNGKQQKSSTDWKSSSSSTTSSIAVSNNSRIDDLNKQLQATNLFDALSSSSPPLASSSMANSISSGNGTNFENQSLATNDSALSSNTVRAENLGNSINDLKQQMSANFNKNDLSDSPSHPLLSALSTSPSSLSASNNSQSQSNAYPMGISPSRDLLKQMVHQIQLAVQAGHLNAQILNQPMSTPTLQLVYTLLQQIKLLQQFQEVQQCTVNKSSDNNPPSKLDLQINRVQQNISLLQKAITQQQAALTKNERLVDSNQKQQQATSNYSYANISKQSTNMKVPSNNISNIISNTSIESFKRSNLIDTLAGNSNSDSQCLTQANASELDATIDRNLSPLLQTVNILNNNKAQTFTSGSTSGRHQQAQKDVPLISQTPTSSAAAWLAFNSSDLATSSSAWPNKISSNVSQQDQQQQQQRMTSDLLSELVNPRGGWRNSSLLSVDRKDNIAQASSASLAPGAYMNLAGPNSTNIRQMNETNDILNKNLAYYDWANNTESRRRNFDSNDATTAASATTVGSGLSLQSNPWLFAPTSSSLNVGSGIDNLIEKDTGNSFCGKLDNGNADKIGGDALNFLRSHDMQRSSSALFDWGNTNSSMQYNVETAPIGSKQVNVNRVGPSSSVAPNSRPAPPPGLMSNFRSIIDSDGSGGLSRPGSEMPKLDANKLASSNDDSQNQSRDLSASLWSGAWFD